LLFVLMLTAALLAVLMRPTFNIADEQSMSSLTDFIPQQFGDWQEVSTGLMQVGLTTNTADKGDDYPYDQVLSRTYKNSDNQTVMLTIAWGGKQRQEVKIHRPELCYAAQGFEIKKLKDTDFGIASTGNKAVTGKDMLAFNPKYIEAVSYWIRIGDIYSGNAWQTRLYIFKTGLEGVIPDGVLVRASSIINDEKNAESAYQLNKRFLQDLVKNVDSAKGRSFLIK